MNTQLIYIVRNRWTDDKVGFILNSSPQEFTVRGRGQYVGKMLQRGAYMLGCEVLDLEFVKTIEKSDDEERTEIDYSLIGL